MDNQTKQLVGFVVSAAAAIAVLVFLSNAPLGDTDKTPFSERPIPSTEEQMKMSLESKSLAEILPDVIGVPVGDVAVVPGNRGWRAIVFGITDPQDKKIISAKVSKFSQSMKDSEPIEVMFDEPPNR